MLRNFTFVCGFVVYAGTFNYVNGEMHNTQYNAYILTPAAGPSAHQPTAGSHATPAGQGTSAPAGGNITGTAQQQYVDYSMPVAAGGYLTTVTPQGSAANLQPSTTSGQLLSAGQFAHYPLGGQLENSGQTGNPLKLLIFTGSSVTAALEQPVFN
jgi:hypothetical protein